MDQNEKERIFTEAIDQAAELVEKMLEDGIQPEEFPGHIQALSCTAPGPLDTNFGHAAALSNAASPALAWVHSSQIAN